MEKKLGKQIDIFFGGPHKFERQPSCRKAGDFPQRSTCWNCQASKTKRKARAGYVGPKPPLRKGVNFRFVTLPWLEIDKHINPQESKITWNRKTKSVYGFHRSLPIVSNLSFTLDSTSHENQTACLRLKTKIYIISTPINIYLPSKKPPKTCFFYPSLSRWPVQSKRDSDICHYRSNRHQRYGTASASLKGLNSRGPGEMWRRPKGCSSWYRVLDVAWATWATWEIHILLGRFIGGYLWLVIPKNPYENRKKIPWVYTARETTQGSRGFRRIFFDDFFLRL